MSKPDERRVRRKTLVPPGESPKLLKVGTEVNALCPVKKLLNPSGLDWPQPWISVTGVIKQILVKNPIVYLVTVRGNHGFQEQEFDNICSSYHVEPLVSKSSEVVNIHGNARKSTYSVILLIPYCFRVRFPYG